MDKTQTWLLVVAAAIGIPCCCAGYNWEKIVAINEKLKKLPGFKTCGKSLTLDQKIINGSPAELGDFPWIAVIGLGFSIQASPEWACGGSLITDQYVITAAHCLLPSARNKKKVTRVRLGELDLNPSVEDGAQYMDFYVDKTIPHHQYDTSQKINDIGLIKLVDKVLFTEFIGPICLPKSEFHTKSFVGYSPTIAGWGKSHKGEENTQLLKAEVEIKNTEECKRNLTTHPGSRNAVIADKVICASYPGKDACNGDSGGPLMLLRITNENENFHLMGIVSYGHGCAIEGYPGVYTRVSEYIAWIIDNLEL